MRPFVGVNETLVDMCGHDAPWVPLAALFDRLEGYSEKKLH
jgi:hypothetical protein